MIAVNILISACLLGLDCRYCGTGCYHEKVMALKNRFQLIPVCPEQMGGLPTPRAPVELVDGRALTRTGLDLTAHFQKGADEVLRLAQMFNCQYAVLKSRSPSCGLGLIYDGTFSGKLIKGNGITVEKLQDMGIVVMNEESSVKELYGKDN